MILILSDSIFQSSMDEVIDWLRYYKADFVRVNGLNPDELNELTFDFAGTNTINLNGTILQPEKVNCVWFYRWTHPLNFGYSGIQPKIVERDVFNQILKERNVISDYFFSLFRHAWWFTNPKKGVLNKLEVICQARKVGLKVPCSLVTNHREKALEFFHKQNGKVITKSLYELFSVVWEGHNHSSFTTALSEKDFQELPLRFHPTLFQEMIEKNIEIRAFYLDGCFYSMAILSQEDKQTMTDFRIYNNQNPNRNVRFELPEYIEKKLDKVMNLLGLKTGSIDIIMDLKGDFYFLEINHVGQYGMTSKPCHYQLEKKIAQKLIYHDRNTEN